MTFDVNINGRNNGIIGGTWHGVIVTKREQRDTVIGHANDEPRGKRENICRSGLSQAVQFSRDLARI